LRINSLAQQTMGLNLMTTDQLDEIHFATLEILEQVGVEIYEEECLRLLKDAGAHVEGSRARIPGWMVKDALASAPSQVILYNRHGETGMRLAKGQIHYGTGSDTPSTIDLETGKCRTANNRDVANAAKVADALTNIDFVMSLGLASDVPNMTSDVHQFEAMILNTVKPIVFTAHAKQGLLDIIEIAEVIAGGTDKLARKPMLALYAEPSSPLLHSKDALEKLLICAEKNIPLVYVPAVLRGATGPVTLAGSLVVANTEQLSGLVIHQLKRKGAPFIYGGGTPPMDMRTFICSYGSPERDLSCISLVKLGQYYNLPTFTTAGCSDAHVFDQQAGMEVGMNLLISGLAGGNLIHDLGYLGIGMISSMESLVMCDEAVNNVKYLLRGVEVNAETLAVDVIKAVGPGGNFIASAHTAEHFRKTLSQPKVLSRDNYDRWVEKGSKPFAEVANERVKAILESHKVLDLPPRIVEKVKAIVSRRDGCK
jgi:trimethylamine---corrinoid protein Co-methyltransferase